MAAEHEDKAHCVGNNHCLNSHYNIVCLPWIQMLICRSYTFNGLVIPPLTTIRTYVVVVVVVVVVIVVGLCGIDYKECFYIVDAMRIYI